MARVILCGLVVTLLLGCGGGGSSGSGPGPVTPAIPAPTPAPAPPDQTALTLEEAHRFLRQATFGPTTDAVIELRESGIEPWLNRQLFTPATLQVPYMLSLPEPQNNFVAQANRVDAWFQAALQGEDQLRQRVAFALSQILVVSERGALFNAPYGLATYYDLLAQRAFGNYRDLLEAVTLSPAMGVYLSMLGNEKPDEARNIRPDENYARELMQLFTIGLVELNLDGTPRLDSNGLTIPTYDQSVIEGFAHVFTGWTYGGSPRFRSPRRNFTRPMQAFADFHDTNPKRLLGGLVLPAGQTPEQDLAMALDNIFEHPNVAPFVSRQLIQKLVSANPSRAYVERVARVFNDDGNGIRGNLGAVVRAILLDEEARSPGQGETGGKLTEPLLRLTALWRAFDARSEEGTYYFPSPEDAFSQAPLRAPSVFNFFSPDFAPSGEIKLASLVSPEMQITNETTSSSVNNYLAFAIFLRNSRSANLRPRDIYLSLEDDVAFASNPSVLVQRIADKLLGGTISDELRAETEALVALWQGPDGRVMEAIHSIASSPEFAVLP
ncbi:MAG: DUF1800 family protein [Pseudomonadota bacterium]